MGKIRWKASSVMSSVSQALDKTGASGLARLVGNETAVDEKNATLEIPNLDFPSFLGKPAIGLGNRVILGSDSILDRDLIRDPRRSLNNPLKGHVESPSQKGLGLNQQECSQFSPLVFSFLLGRVDLLLKKRCADNVCDLQQISTGQGALQQNLWCYKS